MKGKWRYGQLQFVRDAIQPKTKIKDNSFWEFIVPETDLSLKLFFDNLRNYTICAIFISLGIVILKSQEYTHVVLIPNWLSTSFGTFVLTMSAILLAFNCTQTWILIRELYIAIYRIKNSYSFYYRGTSAVKKALAKALIIGLKASDMFFVFIAFIFICGSIIASTSLVYFLVVSNPSLK